MPSRRKLVESGRNPAQHSREVGEWCSGKNSGDVAVPGTVPAVDGKGLDPATVAAMLDEHARLRSLLNDAIAAMHVSSVDYWVGMGTDEVVVRGETAEAVMAGIDAGGTAGFAVVLEFVSAEPQVIVL